MRHTRLLLAFAVLGCVGVHAQVARNSPADRPQSLEERQMAAFEAAIAPYVAQAKASYPAAKVRFEQGLPKGQVFFVTTRLRDPQGRWEQVFLHVRAIRDHRVIGTIASEIQRVSGYKRGQEYSCDEDELLDWLISKPDGSEEGNVVGKFLDTYQP
jgi:uncharacterized protein DUF2314